MGFVDDDSDSEAEGNPLRAPAKAKMNLADGKELSFHNHRILSPDDLRTPTTRNDHVLSITRLRRKGITESEEIWEELEDDALADLSPSSRRRSSAWSNPSRLYSQGDPTGENINESTALLARSTTGRSYRDRRRRRSMPVSEIQERERGRTSTLSSEALGNWWTLGSWWRGREKRDKGKNFSNGNGNGCGDSA